MTVKAADADGLNLFRATLNFNVILRYDPAIKQLLYTTSHCVVYNFDDALLEWNKSDIQGSLALYLRDFVAQPLAKPGYEDLQRMFCYGLILLNRLAPECFSIGLLPNKVSRQHFPGGIGNNGVSGMEAEMNDNLIIVKTLLGEIYGLWVFNEEDRKKLFKLIELCLAG